MRNILIVDDHTDIRRLLCITLGREFVVREAEDGRSAMALVTEQVPDLVLLDVMMPGDMDGLQVLQAIKNSPATQHVPVGMISARGQVVDSDEARRLGADAYFVKPFSPLQVITWVRSQFT